MGALRTWAGEADVLVHRILAGTHGSVQSLTLPLPSFIITHMQPHCLPVILGVPVHKVAQTTLYQEMNRGAGRSATRWPERGAVTTPLQCGQ